VLLHQLRTLLKGASNKDLTEVFENTPSIDPTSVWTHPDRTLTEGTKDAEIDAIKERTDNLPDNPTDVSNLVDLGISEQDKQDIVDGVWNKTLPE
jgi:hypothetical protein